ncbi:MAG TPA: ankyrin repeat domain-containing protein [Fimbriiglobus sp.]|jgi:ankyrin repeat protein
MTDAHAEADPPVLKVARETINQGDLAAFKAYIEAKPDRLHTVTPFGTWLHLAIMRGQPEIAKYLIAAGLDVNKNSGISDSNALDFAASNGDLEMVKYLHAKGAILDTSEPTRNPLFSAIYGGHKHVVNWLLDNGIDYTVRYIGENMTNMDAIAFAMERGQTEIAKMIRDFAFSEDGG